MVLRNVKEQTRKLRKKASRRPPTEHQTTPPRGFDIVNSYTPNSQSRKHTHTHIHTHTHTHTQRHTHTTAQSHAHTHRHTHPHKCTQIHTSAHIHTHARTHTHTPTHTHTHTHTHTQKHRHGHTPHCIVTRAVHLEVTEDLTTSACMTAVRRFIARRGQPRLLLSDNGSNFLGARKQIRRQNLQLDQDFIKNNLLNQSVEWRLNPPSAPHFGSVWERLVQIVKRALLLNLSSATLTWDVFTTIVAEAECLVNARPLTHVRSDNEDEIPITPNQFLIGRAFPNIPASVFNENPSLKTKSWTQIRQRLESIWKTLVREYLPTLNTRMRCTNPESKLEVNDVVWVLEEWTPRGIWPLGRVTRTFTGPDRTARFVK